VLQIHICERLAHEENQTADPVTTLFWIRSSGYVRQRLKTKLLGVCVVSSICDVAKGSGPRFGISLCWCCGYVVDQMTESQQTTGWVCGLMETT